MTIEKLKSVGISLAIAALMLLVYHVAVVQPLSRPAPIEVEAESVTRWNRPAFFQDVATFEQPVTMEGTLSVAGATTLTGDVTMSGDSTLTGDFSAANISASGSVTASGNMSMTTLILEGVTSTGPLIAVTGLVSDNILLAHGLSTTPTAISCTIVNAGILTQSIYISATNATSATFGVFTPDGDVVTDNLTVHCFSTR